MASKFKKLQGEVAKGYEQKGVPPEKAEEIGGAVAAKAGREKLGKAAFQAKAAAGRRKAKG